MDNYILLFISFFAIIVIIYIFLSINKQKDTCEKLDKYNEYGEFQLPNTNLTDISIKDIVFKSAFNCCCIGGLKHDYVDICALKHCYRAGVRVLDFQIFSLNGFPVISASTVNENEYKELYNYLSFSETMNQVNYMFLNSSKHSNNNQVLFLNFRINSNNMDIYNQMAKILLETFSGSSEILLKTPVDKELNQYTLNDLKNKIIIMVDLNASPKMKDSFIKTDLSKLTLVTFGTGFKYHSLYESEASLQSGIELSSLYPNKSSYANNYDYNDKGIRNRFNFIYMNFQKKDAYLKKYLKYFTHSSSFQKSYS
jgi:hypothetical protein